MKFLNKIIIIGLILSLTIPVAFAQETTAETTQSTTTSSNEIFSDVHPETPYYNAIKYVKDQGIVKGYEDGTYQPEKVINRAEFTKIIMEANVPAESFTECERQDSFADVLDTDWFAPYVCVAYDRGTISGYSATSFKPNNPVNFVEASKIIVKGFVYDTNEYENEDWYKPYMVELEKRNAIPTSIRTLDNQVTRGEMAQLIYSLKEGLTNQESNHFYTFENGEFTKIDGQVQTFIMDTSIKLGEPIEVTLDNSDPDGQNTMFDFDTGVLGGDGVTPDFYLWEHFFGDQWMQSVDWNVVEMETSFEDTKECPASGYSSVTNVNEEGYGDPIKPDQGEVFCLLTSEERYVLLEILSEGNDGDDIHVTLKYLIQPEGSRTFH